MSDHHPALGASSGPPGGAGPSLRVVQIVAAFEIVFVAAAAAAALVVVGTSGPLGGGPGFELLVWLSLGLALLVVAMWAILPRLHDRQVRQQLRALAARGEATPAQSAGMVLMNGYAAQTILRGAIAQGPALLGSVGLLMSGNHLGLVPTGLAVALVIAAFPNEARARAFAERAARGV